MQPKKLLIVPPSTTSSSPLSPTIPRRSGPVQYRIEERTRTVYVASEEDITKWDQRSIANLLRVTEVSDTDEDNSHPIERSSSQSSASTPDSKGYPRTTNKSQRYETKSLQIPSPHGAPPSPIRISVQRSRSYERPKVLFYHKHDPHYGFTNFSPHPVVYKGKKYPTSEHLFQSFKFHDHRPGLAEHIRTCSDRPSVVFSEARRFQPEVRPDWLNINIQKMEEALWHKFNQHPDLKAELLSTGNAELIEASDKDAFWGWGADQRGRNELGKALERLRARLRDA